MSADRIDVRIEELVLHGFAHEDRHAIAASLRGELARLLAERGVPAGLVDRGNTAALGALEIQISPGARAGDVGTRAARSVFEGMGR